MIVSTELVDQVVTGAHRTRFLKQVVVAQGAMPIALVRKRHAPGGEAEETRAPVLLLHGYAQNRYAFHLPSRSLANHLAVAGFDVFNADLRGRGRSRDLGARRPRSVLDFVHHDVPAALDEIQALSGGRPVFLVGHSLGGVVSYCVAVDHRAQVAGIVSLGSPYEFTQGSTFLTLTSRLFAALDQTVGLPNLPVPAAAYGKFVKAAAPLVESRLHPIPVRGFLRGSMERHVLTEHMDLAMERGSLGTMRGMFAWARRVRRHGHTPEAVFGYAGRFEALDVPLLVIAGTHDDLAGPAAVRPAFERSRSTDKRYFEVDAGHIDLLVGRRAPETVWPLLTSWMENRAGRPSPSVPAARDAAGVAEAGFGLRASG